VSQAEVFQGSASNLLLQPQVPQLLRESKTVAKEKVVAVTSKTVQHGMPAATAESTVLLNISSY
jgi:hypothetical protein